MSTEIVFIEHSLTKVNCAMLPTNWKLSPRGIEILQNFARDPDVLRTRVLYHSTQTKAEETANIIAGYNPETTTCVEPGLAESSSITNGIIADYHGTVEQYLKGEIPFINGGETKAEALDRFERCILALVLRERALGQNRLGIVTHQNVLSIFSEAHSNVNAWETHRLIKQPSVAVYNFDERRFTRFWGEPAVMSV